MNDHLCLFLRFSGGLQTVSVYNSWDPVVSGGFTISEVFFTCGDLSLYEHLFGF